MRIVKNLIFALSIVITLLLTSCGDEAQVNTAPQIENQSFSVDETDVLGTSIGIVMASDTNGDELTFFLDLGNQNEVFGINSNSGEIANLVALDYEEIDSYAITVNVTDGIETSSAIITIEINDVVENEEPVIENQEFTVSEVAPIGFVVGTVEATDPDGDPLTFEIIKGNTDSDFSIDFSNGEISVGNPLDFASKNSYQLTVSVSDGVETSEAQMDITVVQDPLGAIASDLTNGEWSNPSAVQTNGEQADGDWSQFSIDFAGDKNGGVYTVSGVPEGFQDVWASGTWEFGNENGSQIMKVQNGVTTNMTVTISADALTLEFTVEDPSARIMGIAGDWVFVF